MISTPEDYNYLDNYKEIVKTESFRLMKTGNEKSYLPYNLQWFSPAFGWETIMDLRYSDLAELIELFNKYTEEK